MVHRRVHQGGACRLFRSQGLLHHAPLRLRDLGEYPADPRQHVQARRAHQRRYAHAHPREPAAEGKGSRRGLRAGVRVGHGRRQRGAARAAVHPSDLGDAVLRSLEPCGAFMARSADAVQPVVQRAALGKDDASLPARPRIPLAGGTHPPRYRGGSPQGDASAA